jgi:hypothetical protein
MSKHNKVNPGTYTQAGRLSQDDVARERVKQLGVSSAPRMDDRPHAPKATTSGHAEAALEGDARREDAADDDPAAGDEKRQDE